MTPRELEHAPQLLQIVLMISRMRSVTWRRHGIFSVTLGKYKSKFGGGGGQREAMSRRAPGNAATRMCGAASASAAILGAVRGVSG